MGMLDLIFKKTAKGQAAVEYMTLYGWVLLFAVIAAGIIMFVSGVFSPAALQQKCTMLSLLECTNSYAKLTSATVPKQVTLNIMLKNTGSDTFRITELKASGNGVDWIDFGLSATPLEMLPGNWSSMTAYAVPVPEEVEQSSMLRIFIKGKYNLCKFGKCSGELELNGEVVERVN